MTEVTLPAPGHPGHDAASVERAAQGVIWPKACACCGATSGLDSIPIYFNTAFGRNAIIHIPYCRRCQAHRFRASHIAFQAGARVLIVGLMILLVTFLGGIFADPIVGFLLQLLLLIGAVAWGVRTYFAARAKIMHATTPACTAGQTPAVRFVSTRGGGWRFRFFNQSYAEQFAAANPGSSVASLDLEMPRDWTGRI